MANTITNKKFGVVHGSPSQLSTATIEEGKLYFLAGEADGAIKQGIYGVEGVTPDGSGNITDYKLAMFGTGAVADGIGYGLSEANFTSAEKTALGNLLDISTVTADEDGYVPKADGSDGTIDSSTKDWVFAYDSSSQKFGWYTLPAKAFLNDKGVTSVTITQGEGITCTSSGTAITTSGSRTISLNEATNSSLGGIRLGYTENGKNYKVQVDGSGNAYVNVPWVDKPANSSQADSANQVANTFDVSFGGADILTYNGSANKTLAFDVGESKTIKITNNSGTLTFDTSGVPTTTEMNTAIATALSSALQYCGTVASDSEVTTAATKNAKKKGDVYVASATFKPSSTYVNNWVDSSVEAGDLFIFNGSKFDIINGENQVSNENATLAWNTSTKIATVDGTNIYVKLPSNPNTDTKVTAVGNHYTPTTDASSKITKTASSTTAATWGSTDMITGITLQRDAAGHVTDVSISSIQMPSNPNTDTKVTTVGNHYTPTADASKELSVDASSSTAATWGTTDLVTGVNIQRDAAGHVTGVTVDSIQMPGNPNSDTKVKDASTTNKSFILGHSTQGSTATAQTNASCYMSDGYLYSGGSKVLTSVPDTTIYWKTL